MKQMGIDGLPRNYELVYEAYAGGNPELVREFIALGKYKTQAALDELGRKYLPHQHEASVLQRSAGAISNEMSNFMDLLSQERSSLNDYGRLIGEASQVIRAAGGALGSSLEALQRATELRVECVKMDEVALSFINEAMKSKWGEIRLLAHRHGMKDHRTKESESRLVHSIQKEEGDFIFLEVELSDASEFSEDLLEVTGHG